MSGPPLSANSGGGDLIASGTSMRVMHGGSCTTSCAYLPVNSRPQHEANASACSASLASAGISASHATTSGRTIASHSLAGRLMQTASCPPFLQYICTISSVRFKGGAACTRDGADAMLKRNKSTAHALAIGHRPMLRSILGLLSKLIPYSLEKPLRILRSIRRAVHGRDRGDIPGGRALDV
jgi:hypothetical protein